MSFQFSIDLLGKEMAIYHFCSYAMQGITVGMNAFIINMVYSVGINPVTL